MQNIVSAPAVLDNPITEEIRKHIEAVATRMVGHANLREDDFPDLCQELSLQIIKAAPAYAPSEGSYYTFAQNVIARHRDRIFRYRMRRGIDCPHIPIDTLTRENDEESGSVLDRISLAEAAEEERSDCRIEATRQVLARLPEQLLKICEMLMEGYSHVEIRMELGISERTYFRRFEKIRSKFKKNDFFSKNVAVNRGGRERN